MYLQFAVMSLAGHSWRRGDGQMLGSEYIYACVCFEGIHAHVWMNTWACFLDCFLFLYKYIYIYIYIYNYNYIHEEETLRH